MLLDRRPQEWQLSRRLAADARSAAKAQLRAEIAHVKAVQRRERAIARARRQLPSQLLVTVAAGLATVPLGGGAAFLATVMAGVAGFSAYGSVRALRCPPVPPLDARWVTPTVAPPPDPRSSAWPAVRRLQLVRDELRRLLPLVAPVGRDAGQEAWSAAGEADAALRWQAARLSAVEPHRGVDPGLHRMLYDGVAAQECLVAAVADLVAASADPLAHDRLRDATEALHALAQGLREVQSAPR